MTTTPEQSYSIMVCVGRLLNYFQAILNGHDVGKPFEGLNL